MAPENPPAEPALELWVDPRVARRSRAFAVFLLLNWVGMGYLVLAHGLRSLTGGLAFAFGILTLLAGLSQLRGVRLSTTMPLVRLTDGELEYRPYSAAERRSVALGEVAALRAARDVFVLELRGGETANVPVLALAAPDRERLETALGQRLASGTTLDGSRTA